MDNKLEILNMFLSKKDTISLFWKPEQGWQVLTANIDIINKEYYENGLNSLEPLISKSDLSKFKRFIKLVKSTVKSTTELDKNIIESIFEFTIDNNESYYKISCYLNFNIDKVDSVLVIIEQLNVEDSYRYMLSQIITNDKNPESFNKEVLNMFNSNQDTNYAIVQFDIEGFKNINHQYGEEFGDELLHFIIDNLKIICNKDQLFVRLTADVFMIITPYKTQTDILNLIEQIRKHISNYKQKQYKLVFGINYVLDKTKNLRYYCDGAAMARQSIKGDALKYYAFFDSDSMTIDDDKIWVQLNMEKALKNKEFQVYLQPKYSISTNKIVGAEALVRWVHPIKGIIPPVQFISLFEQNGFIIKLDRYIWEETCKCLANWCETGKQMIPISVNVSRRNMTDDTYIEYLNYLLKKYNIDKQYFELEITETLDDKAINRSIALLKEQGYTLLMDDFGSGYSSLNMLKDTKFDVIKIDRLFLTDFTKSIRGKQIIKSTITMSHSIGLNVIAEGVETSEQVKFLSDCGCDTIQGFYYAKPMTIEEFTNLYNT